MFARLILVPFLSGLLFGVLVAGFLLSGLADANAGRPGEMVRPKSADRPAAPAQKKRTRRPWLERRGQQSERTQREAGLYLGARGSYLFYQPQSGSASVSGYGPPPSAGHTDFTDSLDGNFNARVMDSGAAQLALGLTWPLSLLALNGHLRVEGEAGWANYRTEICFNGIPANQPDLPPSDLFAAETTGPALARLAVEASRVPLCQSHRRAVWNFGGNLFYDLSIAAVIEGMRRKPGIWSGLYLTAGAGAGYVLNQNRTARQILARDADEPLHDGGNTVQFAPIADTNGDDTIAEAPNAVANGIYVPIYAGFSFLAPWLNDVLALEVLYRYMALAPEGVQSHGVMGGIRYRF